MARTVERVVLWILVAVVVLGAYLAYSAYTTVQAQAARVAALETKIDRELANIRAEADARVKRVEDDVARIRRP